MDLLSFARGPMLAAAIAIFCLGVVWRLVAVLLARRRRHLAEPRHSWLYSMLRGARAAGDRSWPHKEFIGRTMYGEMLGYSYHITLFIVVLLFAPHITFIKSLIGVGWPALPSAVIDVLSVITLVLLLAVLIRRLTHSVLKRLSNFDDYFSWFLATLVVATGLLATANIGARYELLLAWHIISFNLLLIWFPFGKLMHAFYLFPSRAINAYALSRKGGAS